MSTQPQLDFPDAAAQERSGILRDLHALVMQALASVELNEREKDVLRAIAGHSGGAHPITSAEILRALYMDVGEGNRGATEGRRFITQTVSTLRRLHKIPIGASKCKPKGYFLIDSMIDVACWEDSLRAQIRADAELLQLVRGSDYVRRVLGQIGLALDNKKGAAA